jgi:hypothetical protein
MQLVKRILNKLSKYGEQFTVDGNTYHGVFRLLDSGTMRNYLSDVEIMGVVRPGLLLLTDPDTDIELNDTIDRDGRTYIVLRIADQRVCGTAVARTVILG